MQHKSIDINYGLPVILIAFLLCVTVLLPSASWAGPPFITDDPEPVEYHHTEFYISLQYADNKGGKEGTLPHFEFNSGVIPDVQLHLLVPLAFVQQNGGPTVYGPGDTEVGVKYRFIHETDTLPQVGIFPIMHIPTGDRDRGLGGGHVPFFLPLWLQKSAGPWTTYGGGGYWSNPGNENKNFWQLGWLVQREISKIITVGAEMFYFGKDASDGRERVGYNVGGIFDVNEEHHILFSGGRDISGDNRFSLYLGYQWTYGPVHLSTPGL